MAASISIPRRFQRLRRLLQTMFANILKITTFAAIALVGGIGTSWYTSEHGGLFATERSGTWTLWRMQGRLDSDPYSRIRYDRHSMLVFGSTFVARYEARLDDNNRRLHSSCHYAIEGRLPASDWWSLTVFDNAGRLIPNPANRHGFNAATVVRRPDGRFRIDLSREARPGNWLPTSRAGRMVVVLDVQNSSGDTSVLERSDNPLPQIKRIGCS